MFRSFVVVLVAGIILATSAGWLNLSSLDDLPPPLCDLQSDSDVRYFSQSYFEGRGKFRALSQKLVREQTEDEAVDSFEMLVLEDEVSGQRYTQDVLVIHGGKNGRLFLHFSGTHGPEGFAGSAVQVRVLTEWKRIKETIPLDQRPTVVMIHAMNPYGFANNRRWNENNVDINRNVILTDEKWAKVLSRDENHGGYVDWSTFINPDHAVTLWERVLFYPQAAYFILRYGKHAMMAALVPGTYHRPEGIFYGGQSLQQSHKNVLEMLRTRSFRVMGEEDNDTSTSSFLSHTKSLVMIDVHTGLGRPGVDTIMCKDTTCAKVAERLFPGWSVENEKPGDEEQNTAGDASAAAYDAATGFTTDYVDAFTSLDEGKSFLVAEEFGTLPVHAVLRAMVVENAAYHYRRGSYHHEQAGIAIRNAFYLPWSEEWKCSVVNRGLDVFERSYRGFDLL
eukprot:TRINITY_DN856_c0_g1_i1.p1 TRINITY_DN856_c0_g1~~TRINITY_DN856_c0_g1_i1.p1  ORF type:complete len:460 (+),score=63.47 TRINITY_DN856_c0_g1_i1:35-1381(+)